MVLLAVSLIIATLFIRILRFYIPAINDAVMTIRIMTRVESLSNPLLLRLSSDAPGTYHHSLNVSNLAQKAAKAIGADSLLVRTAAYYHDIGKLDNPLLYIENQSGIEVPVSEEIESIKKSAGDIIAHVKLGVEIATKNKLPIEIINIIREHHGTTRALYFYEIAKEKGIQIKETDFRYDGPIPKSKESIILMMSDCVEAIARATSNLTPEKINSIVNQTIEDKISDHQIGDSTLTESEISLISNSLKETLSSIYHQRIKYPKHD